MKIRYWTFSLFLFLVPSLCTSHGSLLDGQGCHRAESKNSLHCHLNENSEILYPTTKYLRDAFGGWIDEDNDCQNTRHELLQALSSAPPLMKANGCLVLRGRWLDPYSGKVFLEAREIDIDHLIPLKFAWDRGAFYWSLEKRIKFSNDTMNLFAVDRGLNRQKAAKGPVDWLPPNKEFQCSYVTRFLRVAKIYSLNLSSEEQADLSRVHKDLCN